MKVWVGIDPGVRGAMAVVTADGAQEVYHTPVFRPDPKSQRRAYLIREMLEVAAVLNGHQVQICALEHVHAMPQNGSIGNFSLGRGSGLWEMALTAREISYQLVTPQKWKKHFGLTKDKAVAILKAQTLFPKVPFKKTDDGPAEALLLAHYARTIMVPERAADFFGAANTPS